MVFDGKMVAKQMEEELKVKIVNLEKRIGRRLKLVTLSDQNNSSSVAYSRVKKRMAERLGVEFEIRESSDDSYEKNVKMIGELNEDRKVDGIMIQLPFPNSGKLIQLIAADKDIDGLREDSKLMPATVRAVVEILKVATAQNKLRVNQKVVIIGSQGEVGRRLVEQLHRVFVAEFMGMDQGDFDVETLKKADVVISATGQAGLIKPEMVKDGMIAIDVGYPQGDFDPNVANQAGFLTPVPGGVGPITVVMLFQNLVESVIF